MLYVLQFIYSVFILPPGIFIVGLVGYGVWYYCKYKSVPAFVAVITLALYICSTGLISDILIRPLEGRYSPAQEVQGDVIVMLGGGALANVPGVHGDGQVFGYAANRLLTTAELYQKLKVPVIVSGGQVYQTTGCEAEIVKAILIALGIPEQYVYIETQSRNTTENALFTKRILADEGFSHPILVTSAFHMERAVRQFTKAGIQVEAYPTDYQATRHFSFSWVKLWPSAGALQTVNLAVKEYIGIAASRWY